MEPLASYEIHPWPFSGYKYVSDIIEYEGPLLVHYQNGEKHAFYYWVDSDDSLNRWLCFEVNLLEMYDYLNQNDSLRELILNKFKEPFYTVDIDSNLNYTNFKMLLGYSIPESYLPDTESFYVKDVPAYYERLFEKLDKDAYVEFVRRRSYDLIIEPNNSIHKGLMTFDKIGHFLVHVNDSYSAFGARCYIEKYQTKVTDEQHLLQDAKQFVKATRPLAADNKHHSFQVSMSTDLSDTEGVSKEYMDLRAEVLARFKSEVLDIDLDNDEVVANLIKDYDANERRKIFGPIIKIINDSEYNLTLISKRENKTRAFAKIRLYNAQKIVPKRKPNVEEVTKNKVFLTLTLEVEANKNLRTLSKKELTEATLFSTIGSYTEHPFDKIENDEIEIIFSTAIMVRFERDNSQLKISFPPLNISVVHLDKFVAFNYFVNQFVAIVRSDYMAKTPTNKQNWQFLNTIVQEVQEKELPY